MSSSSALDSDPFLLSCSSAIATNNNNNNKPKPEKPPPPSSSKCCRSAAAEDDDALTSSSTLSLPKGSEGSSSKCSLSSSSSEQSEQSNDSGGGGIYSSFIAALSKPHKANDARWEVIQAAHARDGALGLSHFRLLKRLGCGDIGSVYLAEIRGYGDGVGAASGSDKLFAMKVMDKASLDGRKKILRAQTELQILQCLDHPFLPSLYTHFDTDKFSCLVMEFCPGGDLHMLRQKQPGRHFSEMAAKFYAAEVLLAIEYLHMMGVIYRDLKPENILVREDGHIMLSDFDLSLRCVVSPTLIKFSSMAIDPSRKPSLGGYCAQPTCLEPACVVPACIQPTCYMPKFIPSIRLKKAKSNNKKKSSDFANQVTPLPELIAEPTGARSVSFVGTHEYLAPEIIKGEGHGSAVDWWTFGVFLYELLHGKTPFKGAGNRATLFNVIGQPLKFPEAPAVSFEARDLIRGLLVKDPQHRLGYKRGATEIKQHPFFHGVNWALVRSMPPPQVPKPFKLETTPVKLSNPAAAAAANSNGTSTTNTHPPSQSEGEPRSSAYLDFEFF